MPSHFVATTLQLDREGRIAVWPDSAAQLFGRASADAVGQPLSALVDSRQREACSNVVAHVFRDGGGGLVHTMELVAERGDGATFPAECSLWYCPGDPGGTSRCNVLVRNISPRVRVEDTLRQELRELRQLSAERIEELRRAQSLFVDLVETIDEVFWVADAGITRMLYISPGYERVWGRTCQSLYDDPRSFMEAVHPDDRARIVHDLLQRTGQPFEHEYRIVLPDGRVRWISDRGFPVLNADGSVERYLGVAQDVSVRKALEVERRRQEAADAIAQMASGLANDFSNTLGLVVGHLDLAAFALPEHSVARDSIDAALAAALDGVHLAQRLQSVGRPEPSGPRSLDVADAVDGLRSLLRHASGSEVAVPVTVVRRATVTVDPVAFDAAFITLAMHVRQGLVGGGRLSVTLDEIDVPTQAATDVPGGRYASVVVDVDGPHAADLLEVGRTPAGGGAAHMCAYLRDAGGVLRVETSPQGGCRFRALLPSAPVESDPAVRPEPSWVRAVRDDLFDTRAE